MYIAIPAPELFMSDNSLGTNLSNVPFHGGRGEVISCSGHLKFLLIVLLKDFSQFSLINFQVFGKPGYSSPPIPVALVRNITQVFYAFISIFLPGNLRES